MSIKCFSIIEKALISDEDVLMCFIGIHNYISTSKNDQNFAYVITNKINDKIHNVLGDLKQQKKKNFKY